MNSLERFIKCMGREYTHRKEINKFLEALTPEQPLDLQILNVRESFCFHHKAFLPLLIPKAQSEKEIANLTERLNRFGIIIASLSLFS